MLFSVQGKLTAEGQENRPALPRVDAAPAQAH